VNYSDSAWNSLQATNLEGAEIRKKGTHTRSHMASNMLRASESSLTNWTFVITTHCCRYYEEDDDDTEGKKFSEETRSLCLYLPTLDITSSLLNP
jgi:hypothetical protein